MGYSYGICELYPLVFNPRLAGFVGLVLIEGHKIAM